VEIATNHPRDPRSLGVRPSRSREKMSLRRKVERFVDKGLTPNQIHLRLLKTHGPGVKLATIQTYVSRYIVSGFSDRIPRPYTRRKERPWGFWVTLSRERDLKARTMAALYAITPEDLLTRLLHWMADESAVNGKYWRRFQEYLDSQTPRERAKVRKPRGIDRRRFERYLRLKQDELARGR
jgi:hypothetical protein